MNYIGIDLGTSSVKLVLMDTAGHIIANVSKSYPIDYPKAGWSEQNPYDWYDACIEGMKELLDGQDESTVGGISFGGRYAYTQKDTFMGFHCGNTASSKLSFCEMRNQMIMARSLPEEVTNGTLEGDIVPGDITFFRLQNSSDNKLSAYIAQGEVLPVRTRSFGAIGIFAIPEMGRFYRHVLIEGNFPHHGAVAFGHFGKTLFDVFKYIGVEDVSFNQPKGMLYKSENPFA